MEWVETTGRTVEEAKDLALDQLGVDEEDAEFDVVEEPRPGLFGRMRGEARVRARVRPTRPAPEDRAPGPQSARVPAASRPGPTHRPRPRRPTTPRRAAARRRWPWPTRTTTRRRRRDAAFADQRRDRRRSRRADARRRRRVTEPVDDAPVDEAGRDAERVAAAAFLQGSPTALGETERPPRSWSSATTRLEVRLDGRRSGPADRPPGPDPARRPGPHPVAARGGAPTAAAGCASTSAGYRERRREALARFTEHVADEVRSSGTPGRSSRCRRRTARSSTTRPTSSTAWRRSRRARSPSGGSSSGPPSRPDPPGCPAETSSTPSSRSCAEAAAPRVPRPRAGGRRTSSTPPGSPGALRPARPDPRSG